MYPENEKVKKKYEKYLIGAEEAAASTIDQFLRAINLLDRGEKKGIIPFIIS